MHLCIFGPWGDSEPLPVSEPPRLKKNLAFQLGEFSDFRVMPVRPNQPARVDRSLAYSIALAFKPCGSPVKTLQPGLPQKIHSQINRTLQQQPVQHVPRNAHACALPEVRLHV